LDADSGGHGENSNKCFQIPFRHLRKIEGYSVTLITYYFTWIRSEVYMTFFPSSARERGIPRLWTTHNYNSNVCKWINLDLWQTNKLFASAPPGQ